VLVKVRYTGPRRQTFVAQVKLLGGAFWDLVPAAVLTEDEFTRGEAQYIAPELKSFEPVPTPRTDVYSTGVIFYEMLVGTAPVGTFQLPKARRPDLPNHINDVIELALAQAPEDRYQTAQDCINDIQRTFQASHQTTTNSNKHNIAWTWWAVGLVLVGLVGVILFNLRPEPEKEALAKDSQVRAEVYDNHRKVNPQDILKVQEPFPNMVYVPSGQYVAGRLHQEFNARNSEPLAQVIEVDAFLIDALEFPNLKGKAPKHGVTHKDAEGLCKEAGKRLCTEYEWEKACKGPQNRIYSYGDTFDQDFCGQGLDEAYPAGTKPDCKSGWRTFDQSGNFREWTATAPAGQASRRVVKGGLRSNAEKGTRCAYSHTESAAYRDTSISFRCCLDAPKN
jgi:formylglycine-generating enzyme required for sulfatase activity